MSVRKRTWKSGAATKEAWIVDYVDQAGQRHIETFARKKDADAAHAKIRVDVGKGTHTPISQSLTFAEAAEKWIAGREADGRERTTIRQYRQHIDLHLKPRIGVVRVAALNKGRMELLRDDLLRDLSRPLARKVLTSARSILKVAGRADIGIAIRRDKRKERRLEVGRDIPSPAEVKRLVHASEEPRDRALLLTMIFTGLRASELRGLRWSDVDLKSAVLSVRQRADRYNQIGAPKSEASVRSLPIAPDVLAALKVWKVRCPPNAGDLVFPTGNGAIEHHKNMLRGLAPLMVKAGLNRQGGLPKYGLHAFRHFFASWCLSAKSRGGREMPLNEVQRLLGHSSIVMTADTYAHLLPPRDGGAELAAASRALLG